MKLTDGAFLTDENVDAAVVAWLRERGLEVFDIKEAGLFGWLDEEILERAFEQKQVIISQDSDFGTLVFRDGARFYGIVYLRPGMKIPRFTWKRYNYFSIRSLTLLPPSSSPLKTGAM